MAEVIAIALREMRRRLESAGRTDGRDRHRRLQHELAGALEPQLEVVTFRHAVDLLLEEPLDLTARQPGLARNVLERERVLDAGLHERSDGHHAAMRGANLGPQRHVLAVAAI